MAQRQLILEVEIQIAVFTADKNSLVEATVTEFSPNNQRKSDESKIFKHSSN